MIAPKRIIRQLDHLLCTVDYSEGPVLEVLDETEIAFAKVHIDDNNVRHLTIFDTPERLEMNLDAFLEIMEIAKRNVQIMS